MYQIEQPIEYSVQAQEVDFQLLDKFSSKDVKTWALFSKEELINAIEKYNNTLAPGLNKLSWSYIKKIIKNDKCIIKLIDITNACIYDSPKFFHLIILLNTTGKLFEKMIRERL